MASSRSSTGRGVAVGAGEQRAEERLAARADQQRVARAPRSASRSAQQLPSCARRAWRSRARGRARSGPARSRRPAPRRPARPARRAPRRPRRPGRRTSRSRPCGRRARASASRRTSPRSRPRRRRISGSASPPETSLTMRAPAASAASATSARIVSTETDRAVGGQRGDHRDHPVELLLDQRPGGARPGGLAADVEDVGAVGEQLAAVRDRAPPVSAQQPAVGERVRGDVDDAHQPRRPGRPRGVIVGCSGSAPSPRRGWRRCA